jgi:hypothetical protein
MSNAILEEWSLMQTTDPYTAPELRKVVALGKVYGHPSVTDGSQVTTSTIQVINLDNREIRTLNHTYTLGRPDVKWVDFLKRTNEMGQITKFLKKFYASEQ